MFTGGGVDDRERWEEEGWGLMENLSWVSWGLIFGH